MDEILHHLLKTVHQPYPAIVLISFEKSIHENLCQCRFNKAIAHLRQGWGASLRAKAAGKGHNMGL